MASITIMKPMSSNTCPATLPKKPPAKLSVRPAASMSDAGKREHDPVPAAEREEPALPGKRDHGRHEQAQEQADLGPGPQRVVDRPREGRYVHREERGRHEEQRDDRREAQQD